MTIESIIKNLQAGLIDPQTANQQLADLLNPANHKFSRIGRDGMPRLKDMRSELIRQRNNEKLA